MTQSGYMTTVSITNLVVYAEIELCASCYKLTVQQLEGLVCYACVWPKFRGIPYGLPR